MLPGRRVHIDVVCRRTLVRCKSHTKGASADSNREEGALSVQRPGSSRSRARPQRGALYAFTSWFLHHVRCRSPLPTTKIAQATRDSREAFFFFQKNFFVRAFALRCCRFGIGKKCSLVRRFASMHLALVKKNEIISRRGGGHIDVDTTVMKRRSDAQRAM